MQVADDEGKTALIKASEAGHADCVAALLPLSDVGATSSVR